MKKNNKEIIIGIVIGFLVSSTFEIVATTIIPSESVSYANSKTSEITVQGALDELFDAVDINSRLGEKDITSVGSTITDAISNLNGTLNNHTSQISALTTNLSIKADKTSLNSYLPLSGGTINGNLKVNYSIGIQDKILDLNSAGWGQERNYYDKNGNRIYYINPYFNGDGTADVNFGADKGDMNIYGQNIYLNNQKFNYYTVAINNVTFYYNDNYDVFELILDAVSGDNLVIRFDKTNISFRLNDTVMWTK